MTERNERRKNNIVLIGFMGSGKSTAGRLAAELLGIGFLDTDAEIENAENMPVPEIFSKYGESYFRGAESRFVKRLAEGGAESLVIATGGGIVKDPENMRILREIGLVIYLYSSPGKLWANLKNGKPQNRPLLNVNDPESEIKRLLAERDPVYRNFSDIIIDGTLLNAEETARKIAEIWKDSQHAQDRLH